MVTKQTDFILQTLTKRSTHLEFGSAIRVFVYFALLEVKEQKRLLYHTLALKNTTVTTVIRRKCLINIELTRLHTVLWLINKWNP